MLKYDEETGTITIIAKDTGDFLVNLDNYLLDTGDSVFFTVNNELEKRNPKIQKEIVSFTEDHKALVHLTTIDTNIPVGDYFWDVEIDTADGRVDTVLGPSKFKVKGGVKF